MGATTNPAPDLCAQSSSRSCQGSIRPSHQHQSQCCCRAGGSQQTSEHAWPPFAPLNCRATPFTRYKKDIGVFNGPVLIWQYRINGTARHIGYAQLTCHELNQHSNRHSYSYPGPKNIWARPDGTGSVKRNIFNHPLCFNLA